MLSLFFPAHNEAANIKKTIADAEDVAAQIGISYEIIISNDGSRDETRDIVLNAMLRNHNIRMVRNFVNRGYGRALLKGFRASRGDYVFFSDGDGQFDLLELKNFIPFIKEYDVVIGYRSPRKDPLARILNGKAWTFLVNFLFGMRIRDVDCAFKLFRREALEKINASGLESRGALISTELLVKIHDAGLKIKELPVKHLPRQHGKASGADIRVVLRAFRELFDFYFRYKSSFAKKM